MLGKIIPLFIIVPLVELALLIQLGQWIGTFNTVLLVITTGIIGGLLAKYEGIKVWNKMIVDLQQGQMPSNRILDGVLILVGGVFLLTPGIMTDFLGFSLLTSWGRQIFKNYLKNKFTTNFKNKVNVIQINQSGTEEE